MADPAASPAPPKAVPPSTPSAPVSSSNQARPSFAVGLNEAALDSPTFRATSSHFAEQVDGIERWLEGYVKSQSKLVHDLLALEETINTFLSRSTPSAAVADGVIDNDYTLLALKRVGDGSREWWTHILSTVRRMDSISLDPIRHLLNGELRTFKEARKALEQTQKHFDTTLARYVGQSKTKEASALREDAFAVYEARKAYLKASMDFCQMAPQLRYSLDKLLVRVSADFWREMKRSRESASSYAKWGDEMERVRGWARDLESTEGSLRRELQISRREVGETTLATFKPSRELDDYSVSTVPFLGSRGPMNMRTKDQDSVISEKQGWLFLRTVSGKPARFTWVRRWYYCRDGIFGWLVQSGHGVLQGDEIGVLLCGAKPAVQEERRFCFEIKTKSQTLLLQAETQSQLTEWLEVFEVAKKQAFEASMGRDAPSAAGVDPAFAITPPLVPEFSAKALDSQLGVGGEDAATGADRGATLPVPGNDASHMSRSSFDAPLNPPRRSITTALVREEGESSRDHAARIMQKLDLHRKGDAAPQQAAGGIASLISASHNLLPGYMMQNPSATQLPRAATFSHIPAAPQLPLGEVRRSNLAPVTLAKPPAPTGLSKAAVLTSGELGLGGADPTHTLPTAIMANYWGSNLWGAAYTPRQESAPTPAPNDDDPFLRSAMPLGSPTNGQASRSPNSLHRKTFSADVKIMPPRILEKAATESFPVNYPAELRAQLAQFRLLFPSVPLEEKLVLVFRAAWSSATESGSSASGLVGSGRVYITPDNMYFYGQQMGLITAYSFSLDIISEVTAAPGKDCDYIYLHLNQDTNETGFKRITLKTFLDDLALLHARLNLLVDDLQAEEPMELPDLIDALINLANDDREIKSPGAESWGEGSGNESPDEQTPVPGRAIGRRDYSDTKPGRVTRKLVPKFQLPSHPVVYEPEDMGQPDAERHFEISAKACFHVLFGDKSFIFPKLYFERRAKEIAQGPWDLADQGKMKRTFRFKVDFADLLGRKRLSDIVDQQNIDVFSDHVTYVVTHHGTPWHLPHSQDFKIICKIVITHMAKSKCKLAIYNRIEWTKPPAFSKNIIERQALNDARRNAEELAEVATDQVRKLGPHSRTKRAIQVYGNLGQQTQVVVFTPGEADPVKKTQVKQRTLTDMLSETVFSFAESVASSLMMWTFAGVKKLYDVVTAQRIILLVLALSVFTNLVFSSRETSTWWTERRAAKFMSRIGVGPNVAMSKSIYIADLEEAAQQSGLPPHRTPTDSPCYDTFCNIVNTTDIDAPYEDAGDMLSAASSRAAAKRLRRTRQKLGSYRHDLLVAMRVVNSIEREMVQSEWENWLADEMLRCDQVKALLHSQQPAGGGSAKKNKKAAATGEASKGANGPQKVMRPLDEARIGSLKKWHEEYCGSCRADQRDLEGYRLAHRTMMG